MKWTPKNSMDKKLVDEMGKTIIYALEFDDETKEAKILLTNAKNEIIVDNGEAVKITITLTGAKVVDKDELV